MHLPNLLAALSLAGTGMAWVTSDDMNIMGEEPTNKLIRPTKKFIVEFAKGSDAKSAAGELEAGGNKVVKIFESDVFTGASIESTEDTLESLQANRVVNNVWNSKQIKLPKTFNLQSFSDDASAVEYNIHAMTGVDKLHEAGIYGKGVTVAVVDTGTYYTHEALGGGFGPGFKVAGGYDLVGDGRWPAGGDKVPDSDPLDNLGHGTHVAGIIAGKSENFQGVAPEANILSYKVFSTVDGTDEATLIEAFLMAHEANADIITASIGGPGGWSNNAWAEVASRLVEQGTVVTIAAGNSGDQGVFFASNGAAGKNVLAVASVEASVLPAPPFEATFTLDGKANTTKIAYLPSWDYFPSDVKGFPIYAVSLDTTDRNVGCAALPSTTPNLADSVLLLPKGGDCDFYDKQMNAAAAGARYILFYNDDAPMESPFTWSLDTTIGLIEKDAGVAIIGTLKAGGNVTTDFSLNPETNYVGIQNEAGGVANYFTSMGGLYDLQIKPDIAGPGGNIFSTYPPNTFATMSGTSMACPYIAGVAALYIGQYGGKSVHGPGFAKQLAARIVSSGGALRWSDGATTTDYGFWAPVPQVGTGLVNAVKVLNYDTSVNWAKFALNDTHHFERYHKVDVTNNGKKEVKYKFVLQDAGAFEAIDSTQGNKATIKDGPSPWTPFAPIKMAPKVKMPSGEFKLKPGETKTAEFIFEMPQGMKQENLPIYSGKILVVGSNGEELSVPYMGVGSNVERTFRYMFEEQWPQSVSTWDYIDIWTKPYWKFDLSAEAQDFPKIGYRLRWGGQELRWDIYEPGWNERDWVYPPVVGENGYIGSATHWVNSGYYYYFDPARDNANDLIKYPMKSEVYRSSGGQYTLESWWFGQLANGSQIAPGNYTMRFAALAPFGTPEHSDNWEVFKTPEVQVLASTNKC